MIVAEGIVGQVSNVASHYAKVFLITDRNSAVDALVQRNRARGVINGNLSDQCFLKHTLRKYDINVGDAVVSSGVDGVFPKGLRIGNVSKVVKHDSRIFQEITVAPYVDFEKLEEVFVVLNYNRKDFVSGPGK